jgi:methyltransferase-like protein
MSQNTYDQVPYPNMSYTQSHPDRMATVATLMGMNPPPIQHCRVIELGCASGGNLIPMAYELPGSEFVGIDNSEQQIVEGEKTIRSLGLENIRLEHLDILDVDGDLGTFDYVIAHGVFSWVPHKVQEKLLAVCKQTLAPNGVAFVSYNAYPGWHMLGIIRDMMLYHTRDEVDPQRRASMARGFLDFLAESVPAEGSAYGSFLNMYAEFLRGELKGASESGDAFLLHDELEQINQPFYFWEFAERASQHGLQYLGEAIFRMMMGSNLSPKVNETLFKMSRSVIELEQYMDFVRNRMLRQTLLCHEDVVVQRRLYPEQLRGFRVSSHASIEDPEPDANAPSVARFQGTDGATLATDHPVSKAAMRYLSEVWPESIPFEDLLGEARARLGRDGSGDDERNREDEQVLGTNLLQAYTYSSSLLSLHTYRPPMVLEVSERPVASVVARHQAAQGNRVTNLRHERVTLDDVDRFLIQYLDGSHDLEALVRRLQEGPIAEGTLVIRQDEPPEAETEGAEDVLARSIEKRLRWLSFAALLVG